MRRIVIVLATLALVACGANTATPEPPQQTPSTTLLPRTPTTQSAPTTTVVPAVPTTTIAPSTTTTGLPAATTTTATTPSTTAPPVGSHVVAPYFYVDEDGHTGRPGPFLLPVVREVKPTVAVARAAMEQLLAGPTEGERDGIPAISTAVPSGVRLLGLTISDGIAVVDLSSEFEATPDSAAVAQRAAQVVFTLSRFDSIAEVLFRQDGEPVSIQTGDGQLVDRPVAIDDYLEFAAAISVESPAYGGPAGNPLRVTGFGAVFEATFQFALTDDDGLILEEGVAMTTNGVGWGGFDFIIRYEVDHNQVGALIVWASSAQNGERVDIREYPVVLTP